MLTGLIRSEMSSKRTQALWQTCIPGATSARAGVTPFFLKGTIEEGGGAEERKGKLQAAIRSYQDSMLTPESPTLASFELGVELALGRWIPQPLDGHTLLLEKGLRGIVSAGRRTGRIGRGEEWAGPGAQGGIIWCVPSNIPDSHYFYFSDLVSLTAVISVSVIWLGNCSPTNSSYFQSATLPLHRTGTSH